MVARHLPPFIQSFKHLVMRRDGFVAILVHPYNLHHLMQDVFAFRLCSEGDPQILPPQI